MSTLLPDILLVGLVLAILIVLIGAGIRELGLPVRRWLYVLVGFSLILFANLLPFLGAVVAIDTRLTHDTATRAMMQETLILGGFGFVAIGIVRLFSGNLADRRARQVQQSLAASRQELQSARDMLTSVLTSSMNGIAVLHAVRSPGGDVVDFECRIVNSAATQIIGRSSSHLVGKRMLQQLPCLKGDVAGQLAAVVKTGLPYRNERLIEHQGTGRWYEIAAVKLGDGLAVTFADVSDRRRNEQKLRHAAEHDALTGLPNRAMFTKRVADAVHRAKRVAAYSFAVLFLDFDRFKIINDSLGHEAGDQLLVNIANRLRDNLRCADTATRGEVGHLPARLGGDEFVILLDGIASTDDAVAVAERLQRELSAPHDLGGNDVISTASMGIVFCDGDYDRPEDVIRDADTAMYRAKMAGKARHVVFDEHMHQEAVARLTLERELREAVRAEAFELVYEPIVSLRTGEITGVEALIRWSHPERGTVAPDEFIGVAEEIGIIVPIGEWVLRTACRQLRAWTDANDLGARVSVAVNLSRHQLLHPDIVNMIRRALEEAALDADRLWLEITESMVMNDLENVAPVLCELKALGVRVAIDDFGTGHSSLSCLHRLPIDIVKIDQSFVTNANEKRDYAAIINAVVELAHNMGMRVIAEGVESAGHISLLQTLACSYGQGHLFGRPARAAAISDLLDRDHRFDMHQAEAA